MMCKLSKLCPIVLIFLALPIFAKKNDTSSTVKNKFHAIAFEELYYKKCRGKCTLKPLVGTPFQIEYKIRETKTKSDGYQGYADITLNGKEFPPLTVGVLASDPLPFHQGHFFEDHRFQIYTLSSSTHARNFYDYYFVRQGDEFFLLSDLPLPGVFYDYDKEGGFNEKFYALEHYGGGEGRRINYKLENNRFIETSITY